MKNLRDELNNLYFDVGIFQKEPCSRNEEKEIRKYEKEHKQLPEGIHGSYEGYYRVTKTDLSEDEIEELFRLRQINYLRTIKNCMVFFLVLIIVCFILFLMILQ